MLSLIGALPFFISREIPSYIDALFETVSGFTTTGASVVTDVEAMSHGILFWRSFTHWIGGMGVLVLMMAIIPTESGSSIPVSYTHLDVYKRQTDYCHNKNENGGEAFFLYFSMTAADGTAMVDSRDIADALRSLGINFDVYLPDFPRYETSGALNNTYNEFVRLGLETVSYTHLLHRFQRKRGTL